MFVVKDEDGKNDHKNYKSIYFNYFLICSNRVKLFLAMQVRVMAACMESQSIIRSAQSRPRDRRGVSDVCGTALSLLYEGISLTETAMDRDTPPEQRTPPDRDSPWTETPLRTDRHL